MDIPPSFLTPRMSGKVCKLRKSLYGLKQSPRAWFDIFRCVVCGMVYKQSNGDHTMFYLAIKMQNYNSCCTCECHHNHKR